MSYLDRTLHTSGILPSIYAIIQPLQSLKAIYTSIRPSFQPAMQTAIQSASHPVSNPSSHPFNETRSLNHSPERIQTLATSKNNFKRTKCLG